MNYEIKFHNNFASWSIIQKPVIDLSDINSVLLLLF